MNSKAEQKRRKAAIACVRRLEAAAKAVDEYLRACRACNDGSGDQLGGISDSRTILRNNMTEYAGFLSSKYEVENA